VSQLHSTRHLQTMSLCLFAKLILPDPQRAAQTKKQLRRSVRIYREVKDKAGRNGLPCPFYTV
jgi:hypothetical protein